MARHYDDLGREEFARHERLQDRQRRSNGEQRGYHPEDHPHRHSDDRPGYGPRGQRDEWRDPPGRYAGGMSDSYGHGAMPFDEPRAGYGPYARPDRAERQRDRHLPEHQQGEDRGFLDRAGDEIASWFGDEAAHARREEDHRGRGPKGYVRSDARIDEDVHERLTDDPYVDASEITVSVSDREVTLDGTVDSRRAKRRAEDCAHDVSGVTHVQNNLRVKVP
ncbi:MULTISPECIES: BON domain-containing protein [unclassified Roseovarius]|uniref:BON domain-containing protein n=1 Tax=unclassified Roseovarius TaxID=2614913 RepID=UPI00273E8342|nr:BON domain-containing protein [Roseovarius sp. MMSF_3350]